MRTQLCVWLPAPSRRVAFYADLCGQRLHVEQLRAHPVRDAEFRARVGGLRVGEYGSVGAARLAAIVAATKKAAAGEPAAASVSTLS